MYMLVWLEGLATYVSHQLNPKIQLEEIFLGQKVQTEVAPKTANLSQKILDNFDNGSPDVWKPLLSARKVNDEIPPRSGYYIGYKIAEELGKKKSLQKLTQLTGENLRKQMKSVLKKLTVSSN